MSGWPGGQFTPEKAILATMGLSSAIGRTAIVVGSTPSAGAWPAANRALFIPVELEFPATAYQMSFVVGTQSGNYDIGIYDELFNALYRKGSTAVPAAGLGLVDITDTVLVPGVYFIAMNVDNVTATFNRNNFGADVMYRAAGMNQQAVGAVTLPNPPTPVGATAPFVPQIQVHLVPTV